MSTDVIKKSDVASRTSNPFVSGLFIFACVLSSIVSVVLQSSSLELTAGSELNKFRIASAYTFFQIEKASEDKVNVHYFLEPKSMQGTPYALDKLVEGDFYGVLSYKNLGFEAIDNIENTVRADISRIFHQEQTVGSYKVVPVSTIEGYKPGMQLGDMINSYGMFGVSVYSIGLNRFLLTVFTLISVLIVLVRNDNIIKLMTFTGIPTLFLHITPWIWLSVSSSQIYRHMLISGITL